ncbi:hypothetical protein [Sphingobium phenoxybenzoativorans]|uniref:DODA-type extradiol aromatic ring-opening family dioxygenase n=1 Tax=Sphingobium phenoxybenzoativorans TaxID=1592790 RepID=UPI00087284DE|nr:hypothetical protein [Sphingobium phenoxybenzoativorans]
MPLELGLASSYAPSLYRGRDNQKMVTEYLIGDAVQPPETAAEGPAERQAYIDRFSQTLDRARLSINEAGLDTLVVLIADDDRYFSRSNTPQFHVFIGEEIWGDSSIAHIGETANPTTFNCDEDLANFIAQELVLRHFDIAESRGAFRPVGDPERGMAPGIVELLRELKVTIPIVPIHINCHSLPRSSGSRLWAFGEALGEILGYSDKRLGMVVSGGMSGDPRGYMAGWIDEKLDRWAMQRLALGRSEDLIDMWSARSLTLNGTTAELRLWLALGAAMERSGAKARVCDYFPFHGAAAGIGTMVWEARP